MKYLLVRLLHFSVPDRHSGTNMGERSQGLSLPSSVKHSTVQGLRT